MTNPEATTARPLNHRDYYRMPWSLTDNAMSWLEITTRCNITCIGCYRDPRKDGHKTLDEIRAELEVFKKLRNSDGMSIAGGEPLIHPQIVEVTKMVSEMGWKPLINTNGRALTPELLKELKAAGAASFTFHIDTTQTREDAETPTEVELIPLREKFADMLAEVGGMTCGYNTTVTRTNLHEVPKLIEWAAANTHRVHSIHFITYRDFGCAPDFDRFANGTRVAVDTKRVHPELTDPSPVKSVDVIEQIRTVDPLYEPSAYLSGNCDPRTMKWTFASRLVLKGRTLGYAGPRFMELTQRTSHWKRGKWLGIPSPRLMASARLAMFFLWFFDKPLRSAFWQYIKAVFCNPVNLFRRVRTQTILLLQPLDILPDGRMNMCDGCPDITVHENELYWSCRLEEIKEFGTFLTAAPKDQAVAAPKKKFFHEEDTAQPETAAADEKAGDALPN